MTGYENDNQTVLLTAFAKALSIGIKDPRLQILVTNVENLTAYIYSEFAYEPAQFNIRRFNQLTEQDLSNLGNLTGLMKKRVGELNTLKEKLASATQFAQYSDCAKKKSGESCDAAKSCIKIYEEAIKDAEYHMRIHCSPPPDSFCKNFQDIVASHRATLKKCSDSCK